MNKLELLLNYIASDKRKEIIVRIINTVIKDPTLSLKDLSERLNLGTKCLGNYIKLLRDNEVLYPRKSLSCINYGYRVILENAWPIPKIKK